MAEHYTRNTTGAALFCNKCYRITWHRILGGKKGPCTICLEKLTIGAQNRKPAQTPAQGNLFVSGEPESRPE